jgi:arsenate reductase-like glutaredoxin family protein
MAEGGYYFKWRSFWEDIPKDHVYAKHEAWEWLFAWAEFNGDKTGKHETHLSTLANEWNWKKTGRKGSQPDVVKVGRFLDECVKKDRITYRETSERHLRVKGKSGIVITITNYLKLQLRENNLRDIGETSERHLRDIVPEVVEKSDSYKPLNKKQLNKNTKTISDVSTSQHAKVEKPKVESTNEFRRVTDYMWDSYEKKYKVRPDSKSNLPLFKILRPLVEEWGEAITKQAWDAWLGSEDTIPVECNHSPKTFSSTFWFNKCRVEATKVKTYTRIDEMSYAEQQAYRKKEEEEFEKWAKEERRKEGLDW